MNLDDWIDLIKLAIGPTEFKEIAIEFLREFYRVPVLDADGKDGGIDAWVVLSSEPRVRVPAQFHAGKAESWDAKLKRDAATVRAFRDELAPDDPRRLELGRLLFVCSQEPDARKQLKTTTDIQRDHALFVEVFDPRQIASLALQNRGRLLDLLAQRLPGTDEDHRRERPSARDELLLAFSFFHTQPTKYRVEVAKSAIATVLHRGGEQGLARQELIAETAQLLGVSPASRLVERALKHLHSEKNVTVDGERVSASKGLAKRTETALRIAKADEEAMHGQCVLALDQFLAKGTHHRVERARRAVGAVLGDLGLLLRDSVVKRALQGVDGGGRHGGKADDELRRWQALERRLAQELELEQAALKQALAALVRVVADTPFARNLAAAELFLQITEYEAHELAAALTTASPLHVVLDASIAMPMICALYDRPAAGWATSVAAFTLHEDLRARGARVAVPSLYVEEIAAHLTRAWGFVHIIETEPELERSGNFFVAHFCSTRGATRSADEFREFLGAFGAVRPRIERRKVEEELRGIFNRYDVELVDVGVLPEDPELDNEPGRDEVLIRHDRAVVRWLTAQKSTEPVFCTADRWLQGVIAELGRIALDSAALADLLELVRPVGVSHGLLSPLVIARALTEEDRTLAASVWDFIAATEGENLADWRLVKQAREFLRDWLAKEREPSALSKDWAKFREQAVASGEVGE